MSIPNPSERFRDNIVLLLDELKEMFEEALENNLIGNSSTALKFARIGVKKVNSEMMLKLFIKRTHQHWESIHKEDGDHIESILSTIFGMVQNGKLEEIKKDEDLKEAKGWLSYISKGSVENLKTVLTGTYKDEDGDEEAVFDENRKKFFWSILKGSVKISLFYIQQKREINEGGKCKNEFFPEINVLETAKKWGAILPNSKEEE